VVVKYSPTEEQKRAILRHVFYEIEQLLQASWMRTDDACVGNALLESILVHVRTLCDFYESSRRSTRRSQGNQRVEQDDVLVTDFGFAAQKMSIPPDDRERLNKDLAHLTYSRLERRALGSKWWNYKLVVDPILVRSSEFVRHLLSGYLNKRDKDLIADCKKLLVEIDCRLRNLRQVSQSTEDPYVPSSASDAQVVV
jgi:hypothetical protein